MSRSRSRSKTKTRTKRSRSKCRFSTNAREWIIDDNLNARIECAKIYYRLKDLAAELGSIPINIQKKIKIFGIVFKDYYHT